MPPDPKPRKRVKDPNLRAEFARKPCQITGLYDPPNFGAGYDVDTHHLIKHPRHDEPGNLFRIVHSLHMEYEQGTRRQAIARLIRAYMTPEQISYVEAEKGEAWLDLTYPPT